IRRAKSRDGGRQDRGQRDAGRDQSVRRLGVLAQSARGEDHSAARRSGQERRLHTDDPATRSRSLGHHARREPDAAINCGMTSTPAFSVAGKVAVITGASSGFGKHFAKVLAREGAKVGLAARRVDVLQSLAQEIRGAGGAAAVAQLDVADAPSIPSAIDSVERDLGRIDVLVNNSGISVVKPLLDYTEQDWDAVVDVNLKGAFFVA